MISRNACSLAILILFAAVPFVPIQQDDSLRTWTSANKNFSVRARLVRQTPDGKIELQKEGGRKLLVEIDRLSDSDKAFLSKSNPGVKGIGDTDNLSIRKFMLEENRKLFATEVLRMYETAKDIGVTGEVAEFVDRKIAEFTPKAKKGLIRYGVKNPIWISETEVISRNRASAELIEKWHKSASNLKSVGFEKMLDDAAKENLMATDALNLLGLHWYFQRRDYTKASKYFREAIRRGETYNSIYDKRQSANYAFALNNLAVVLVRNRNMNRAHKVFEQALAIEGVEQYEIAANVARVKEFVVARNKGVAGNDLLVKKFARLAEKAGAASATEDGWCFLLPVPDSENKFEDTRFLVHITDEGSEPKSGKIIDRVCLVCNGTTKIRCANTTCNNGLVKVPVIRQRKIPNLDRTITVRDLDTKTCPVCRGTAHTSCQGCRGRGVQR